MRERRVRVRVWRVRERRVRVRVWRVRGVEGEGCGG